MMRFALVVVVACGPPMYGPSQPTPSPSPSPSPPSRSPSPSPSPSPSLSPPSPSPSPPSPSPTPPPSPSPSPSPPPSPPNSVAQQFVAEHNALRAKHCAQPLTWSPQLAAFAQRWADTLRSKGCSFGHSSGQYGENLAAGTIGALDPKGTVDYWYSEIKDYRFPNGGFSMTTGHFTQLLWRDTTHVGCGHSQCNGNDIWVCEYDPPGNVEGEYRAQVLPTGCR